MVSSSLSAATSLGKLAGGLATLGRGLSVRPCCRMFDHERKVSMAVETSSLVGNFVANFIRADSSER